MNTILCTMYTAVHNSGVWPDYYHCLLENRLLMETTLGGLFPHAYHCRLLGLHIYERLLTIIIKNFYFIPSDSQDVLHGFITQRWCASTVYLSKKYKIAFLAPIDVDSYTGKRVLLLQWVVLAIFLTLCMWEKLSLIWLVREDYKSVNRCMIGQFIPASHL
jgi:hypothetical protein